MTSLAAMLGKPGAMVQCDDDPEAVFDLLCEKGWSDGLPIVPPTEARVARMLAWCDRPVDQPIAVLETDKSQIEMPTPVAGRVTMLGGKVLTLSDSEGFIYDPEGMTQDEFFRKVSHDGLTERLEFLYPADKYERGLDIVTVRERLDDPLADRL